MEAALQKILLQVIIYVVLSPYNVILYEVKYTFVGEKLKKLLAANISKMPIFGRPAWFDPL